MSNAETPAAPNSSTNLSKISLKQNAKNTAKNVAGTGLAGVRAGAALTRGTAEGIAEGGKTAAREGVAGSLVLAGNVVGTATRATGEAIKEQKSTFKNTAAGAIRVAGTGARVGLEAAEVTGKLALKGLTALSKLIKVGGARHRKTRRAHRRRRNTRRRR